MTSLLLSRCSSVLCFYDVSAKLIFFFSLHHLSVSFCLFQEKFSLCSLSWPQTFISQVLGLLNNLILSCFSIPILDLCLTPSESSLDGVRPCQNLQLLWHDYKQCLVGFVNFLSLISVPSSFRMAYFNWKKYLHKWVFKWIILEGLYNWLKYLDLMQVTHEHHVGTTQTHWPKIRP